MGEELAREESHELIWVGTKHVEHVHPEKLYIFVVICSEFFQTQR